MKLRLKTIISLFFLFTVSVTFAQDESLILTPEENKEWMENLKAKKNKLGEQLRMIRKRIIADTAIMSSSQFICYTGISDEKRKETEVKQKAEQRDTLLHSRHRPMYQFVKNGEVVDPGSIRKGSQAAKLVEFIVPEKVASAEVFYNQPENVLYGVRGESGVILIELKDDKTFQRLRELLY